jgi:hypothetical protein
MRKGCAAAVGVFVLAWSALASAQRVPGKDVAKKLFEEGAALEKKSDYAGALAKYREAQQITMTAGLRFHEAYCLEKSGKLASAADAYESTIKLSRKEGKADVEAAAKARLDPLAPRVPMLSVRLTSPPAADATEVKLDGTALAALLLDGKPFRVDPGEHTVTARAEGYAPFTKTFEAVERGAPLVRIELEKAGGAAAGATAVAGGAAGAGGGPAATTPARSGEPGAAGLDVAPPDEPPRGRSLLVPIVATAGAAVFLAGGVVSYVVAGSAASDANDACPTRLSCDDEQTKVRTLDAFALGGFIGAVGFGAIAVVTWTSGAKSSSRSAAPRVQVVASPSRVGLAGSF